MHYILVTEFESSKDTTCKIVEKVLMRKKQVALGVPAEVKTGILTLCYFEYFGMNLPSTDLTTLEEEFSKQKIVTYCLPNNVFEVDVHGVQLLTKLSEIGVVGQSMAIEHTVIGGGTVKVLKIVWTLMKE